VTAGNEAADRGKSPVRGASPRRLFVGRSVCPGGSVSGGHVRGRTGGYEAMGRGERVRAVMRRPSAAPPTRTPEGFFCGAT
jgi:hypothetical protein